MRKVILPLALAVGLTSIGFNAAQYASNEQLTAELDKKGNEIADEKKKNEDLSQEINTINKENESLKESFEDIFTQKSKLEEDILKLKYELEKKKVAEKKAELQAQVNDVKKHVSVSRGQSQVKESVYVTATAYTAYCYGCSGITKTGIDLRKNPNLKLIAVDPNVIPLGTKVYVEGYGYAIAGDTGGAIKGNRIDLHMPTKTAAYEFGRQHNIRVDILK